MSMIYFAFFSFSAPAGAIEFHTLVPDVAALRYKAPLHRLEPAS